MMEDSSDESSDESSSDTEVETVKSKKQAKGGKSNDEKANKRDRKQKANAGTSNDKKSKKGNKNDQEANNQQAASGHGERNPASSGAAQNQIRMKAQGSYPEALPDMHPRRPNYIAPVRAEVVQTERVIETPYDPAPNAYFDDEHGVVRIYHGGAYGSNANHGLYPRRDKPFRPMPMGMPHPLQNPYLGGFNQPQGHHAGDENNHNIPVTQGMPINAWNAMYGPSGMPADPNFAYPGQNWPHQMHGYGMGKGHHPPSTHDKDKAGADNVMPPEIKVCFHSPILPRFELILISSHSSLVEASRLLNLPHNDPPSPSTTYRIPKAAGRATAAARAVTTKAEAGAAREDRTRAAPTKARILAGVMPTPPPTALGATTTPDRTGPTAPGAATKATTAPAGATTIMALRAAAATTAPGAATTTTTVVVVVLHGAPPRTTARHLEIRMTTITTKAARLRARMVSTTCLRPWPITTSSLRCRVAGVIPLPLLRLRARPTLTGDARLWRHVLTGDFRQD